MARCRQATVTVGSLLGSPILVSFPNVRVGEISIDGVSSGAAAFRELNCSARQMPGHPRTTPGRALTGSHLWRHGDPTPLTFCMLCTHFRLRQSQRVRLPQVRVIRESEAVALGLLEPGVVVTSGVTSFRVSGPGVLASPPSSA
jgi:hypothetical protein